jgi:glutathione peroxidase-family protein
MAVHDISVNTLSGQPSSIGDHAGKTLLIVNVASKCGLTPQYTALQQVYDTYTELTQTADAEGHDGDIRWNFEKFLISPDGEIVARYSPVVVPDDPTILADIEANLPS